MSPPLSWQKNRRSAGGSVRGRKPMRGHCGWKAMAARRSRPQQSRNVSMAGMVGLRSSAIAVRPALAFRCGAGTSPGSTGAACFCPRAGCLSASARGLDAAPKSNRGADCQQRWASDYRAGPALPGCRDRASALAPRGVWPPMGRRAAKLEPFRF